MKKINNFGFLLVETLVVATFCLTVLVILFLQFKSLVISYNNSYKYNTVEGIYSLNTVKKYLTQGNFTDKLTLSPSKTYVSIIDSSGGCSAEFNDTSNNYCEGLIEDGNFKTVIYTDSNINAFKNSSLFNSFSNGFKDFVKQLKNQEGGKRLIAEFKDGTFATIVFGSVSPATDETVLEKNMNNWTYRYTISKTYDSVANFNTLTLTTIGGWEQAYLAIPTEANKTYVLTFDYKINSPYTVQTSSYKGIGYQAVTAVTDSSNIDAQLAINYLPTAQTTEKKSTSLTFKTKGTTTYFVFNFGMVNDGQNVSVGLGNFKLKKIN